MKKKEKARIVSQEKLQEGIYSLVLGCEAAKTAVAGQFVSLYLHDQTKLLPRPISICEIDRGAGKLRLVYRVAGEGTKEISTYPTGAEIEILGPLGNGFFVDGRLIGTGQYSVSVGDEPHVTEACPVSVEGKDMSSGVRQKRVLLIGGGIGIPPMVGLAEALAEMNTGWSKSEKSSDDVKIAGSAASSVEVISVMGYRDKNTFLTKELSKHSTLYIATDDGSLGTHGTVLDAIREQSLSADIAYACGPKPMLRGLKEWAKDAGIPLYVSMEERMACGIGACLGCVCETTKVDAHAHVNNARVCKDGPVFYAEDVVL